MNNLNNPFGKDEKICYNCNHIAFLIGIGQGLKCSHPSKTSEDNSIPSMSHTCEFFTNKNNSNNSNIYQV
jgi:hypothetical protein